MKKITILIFIFLAIALIAAGFYFFLTRQGADKSTNPGANGTDLSSMNLPEQPMLQTSTLPTTDKIVVSAPSGGVQVNNFYKTGAEVYPWRDVDIRREDGYQITYAAIDESFFITIRNQPVEENIVLAEKEFLSSLGISQIEACRLNVWVGVMGDVDRVLSGRNLGLSFCR